MAETKGEFETLLRRLEDIADKMDGGGLSLNESMKLYEEGIKNSDRLTVMLAEARDRVMKLMTDRNGKVSLDLFDQGNAR